MPAVCYSNGHSHAFMMREFDSGQWQSGGKHLSFPLVWHFTSVPSNTTYASKSYIFREIAFSFKLEPLWSLQDLVPYSEVQRQAHDKSHVALSIILIFWWPSPIGVLCLLLLLGQAGHSSRLLTSLSLRVSYFPWGSPVFCFVSVRFLDEPTNPILSIVELLYYNMHLKSSKIWHNASK